LTLLWASHSSASTKYEEESLKLGREAELLHGSDEDLYEMALQAYRIDHLISRASNPMLIKKCHFYFPPRQT